MSSILLDDPLPLSKVAPSLPPGLSAVVEKAMAKDRKDRYGTVAEMIADLIPFNEAAAKLMTDSAASALKQSIAPPPPMEQQDTMLITDQNTPPLIGSGPILPVDQGMFTAKGVVAVSPPSRGPGMRSGKSYAPPSDPGRLLDEPHLDIPGP